MTMGRITNSVLKSRFVSGVSNWGGYALACALYILNTCEVHGRYLRKAGKPSRAPGEQHWAEALPSVAKVTGPHCPRTPMGTPLPWCPSLSHGPAPRLPEPT